jgi:hypothetical protein
MVDYLSCLKKARGTNDPECRWLAKAYLQCRMDQYVYTTFCCEAKLLLLVANTGGRLTFPYAAISWRRTSSRTWVSVKRMGQGGIDWRKPQRARNRLQSSTRHVEILHGSENRGQCGA